MTGPAAGPPAASGPGGAGGTGAGPGDAGDPLQQLLRVQDLDTAVAQLRHRRATLAERRDLEATEDALAAAGARQVELGGQRDELQARQAELEAQVEAVAARRRGLEDRMYAARGSAARDLQAMDGEIRHLADRRAELEEAELELMVAQEPLDEELARLAGERARLEEARVGLAGALREAEAVVGEELAAREAERVAAAGGLPAELTARYDELRQRLGGVGAARLAGNRCDGCHLELPSAEVDRIRHLPPGTAATCDQCGRILVRVPPAG